MIDKEKLKQILKELARPPKFEVGFVDARRVISDGLAIIGLDSTDILGFAKEENETIARRTKGAQAWFKRMYEDGWGFKGMFEYEGLRLLYGGFIIMERELPNKRLTELIETLTDEKVVRTSSEIEIDRGPELPELLKEAMSTKAIPYIPLEKTPKSPAKIAEEIADYVVPKTIKEPVKGFQAEIDEVIRNFQNAGPTLEEQFFEDTGKNAVWKGKETKAFIKWKEDSG